jgi:PAS domain S-box-containing protein
MGWVLLVIPLTIRGNTVGLWLFGRRDPDDYYPQHDISLLNTLGSQVAVAIENTRLYEQAQQEIAERLRIEKSLRRERDISQQYLDVAGVMLVALNLDGEITLMNRRGYEILGYARGELEGRNWFDVCLPQRVRPEMERILQQLVAGEAAPEEAYEKPVLTRSGEERIISWHNTTLTDETGAIVGMLSSGEDVTDRVRAEEARMRLVAAIEQAGEAVIIVNDSGEAQYVNPSFERLTGYSEDEVLGHTPGILGGKTGKPTLNQQMWEGVRRGEPWSGHLQGEKKDGRSYEVEASVSPIEDPTRQTREYVVILRDVTQEVALEAQLRQAQKMEAVGRLAGGVAHDFNNLLTVIQGYTRLLDNSLSAAVTEKEPLRLGVQTDLREIERAAERAAELTRQLLAFSRKQMLQPKILNLNDVIRNVERMLGRLIGEDIDLVVRLDPALGTVKADPGQMEQVIMNLSINARDAMPNGGQLVLQTANFVLDAASARDHLDIEPGPYARLVVRDTGIGMDEETRSHLFEPFFTTKGLGKGTGLGLATVFGIVKQSDGDIQVSSRPGEGTSFEIYLPQVDEAAAVADIAPAHATSVRGAETILLVEDEDTVRALAQRILRRYGYTVLQAADANEALAVIERYQDPIHLVVTDVIMPGGMGGGELVSRLSSVRPGMKVLFMSGYTDEVIGTRGVVDPGLQFLQKPFTPDALARKVRGVLDGS